MKSRTRLFLTAILLAVGGAVAAALPAQVNDEPLPSLAPLVERVTPAVVNIRVSQTVSQSSPFGDDAFRRFFGIPDNYGGSREVASAGSGVIVDAGRGYILTNHHVVESADEIQVSLITGEILDAEIVGSDAATDIAVLKVESDGLTEMPIGDSEIVRVGDFVLAIGNPFGLGHTVTSGIVSALGRTGINSTGYEDFIQTDASINPGNSGGALVNMRGELVGINSAIISRSGGNVGIGFAVPATIASSVMRQLLDFGEVRRGLLGVSIQTIDREIAKALEIDVDSGALISMVEPGSAAEEAGLHVDDIIVEVNKEKISGAAELRNAIGLKGSGEQVDIKYVRGTETRTTTATLRQQAQRSVIPTSGVDIHPGLVGAEFAAASTTSSRGIEVTSVVPDSPAAQRGLQAGDIISAANRRDVRKLEDLAAIAAASSRLFLLVQRGDRAILLQIR
ncbi:MAG: Do family serine endopeptidase [Proteobacteria bacterium]|nr:Do family serine endopeptidase [Pseudomonadota bacterium]